VNGRMHVTFWHVKTEGEGFEPSVIYATPVFKTGARFA